MACKRNSSSCTRRAAVATLGSTASGTAAPAMVQALTRLDINDHLVVRHRRVAVNGIELFYREAGHPEAPAVLLLHGFPTSSHMFRHLIPALAGRYRVVAPDYPGFGFSGFPDTTQLAHTFAAYADIIEDFIEAVGLARFVLYIQDCGAPIGLRLALKRPERIAGIIAQNGNAYEEGLSEGWKPLKKYWRDPTCATKQSSANGL
jgi:pimeloyl-ACP methyl ester carboxylesterase